MPIDAVARVALRLAGLIGTATLIFNVCLAHTSGGARPRNPLDHGRLHLPFCPLVPRPPAPPRASQCRPPPSSAPPPACGRCSSAWRGCASR
jgi:hypothetical protein